MIDPDGEGGFPVFCDQTTDGGGWTVFQRRQDGSVDFFRTWNEYKVGFGDVFGEYWLGNEKILRLTHNHESELRVDLESFAGESYHAVYDSFMIGDEDDHYRLYLGNYQGTDRDSMDWHRNMIFGTKDKAPNGCPNIYSGAWWYRVCHTAHLNGIYIDHMNVNTSGITWTFWKNRYETLKTAKMMLRRRKGRKQHVN